MTGSTPGVLHHHEIDAPAAPSSPAPSAARTAAALIAQPSRRYPTGVRNRALLRLMYRGGLRVSEALNLTPRDVDLRRGEIRVNRGKGDRDRVVWVDDTTVEMLAAWQAIRPRSPRFFSTLKGGKLQPSYVRTMTARYGRKAGIGIRVHPHLLRHTMASEALEEA